MYQAQKNVPFFQNCRRQIFLVLDQALLPAGLFKSIIMSGNALGQF